RTSWSATGCGWRMRWWSLLLLLCGGAAHLREGAAGGVEHPGVAVEAVRVQLERGDREAREHARVEQASAERALEVAAQQHGGEALQGDEQGAGLGVVAVVHGAVGDALV